eukprot:121066-Chlamydomonas_euryale.AAC.5
MRTVPNSCVLGVEVELSVHGGGAWKNEKKKDNHHIHTIGITTCFAGNMPWRMPVDAGSDHCCVHAIRESKGWPWNSWLPLERVVALGMPATVCPPNDTTNEQTYTCSRRCSSGKLPCFKTMCTEAVQVRSVVCSTLNNMERFGLVSSGRAVGAHQCPCQDLLHPQRTTSPDTLLARLPRLPCPMPDLQLL